VIAWSAHIEHTCRRSSPKRSGEGSRWPSHADPAPTTTGAILGPLGGSGGKWGPAKGHVHACGEPMVLAGFCNCRFPPIDRLTHVEDGRSRWLVILANYLVPPRARGTYSVHLLPSDCAVVASGEGGPYSSSPRGAGVVWWAWR